jgi:rhodanese-related sulfurtransferase
VSDRGDDAAVEVAAAEAIGLAASTHWLLDVREQYEWDQGHAPNAHLIPMSALQERVGEIPEDAPILVVCHSGYRSWQVTMALLDAGYNATNISGGMDAWQSAGGVVVTDDPTSSLA